MDTYLPIVEKLFQSWHVALGDHQEAYRNHVYRLISLTRHFYPEMTDNEANLLQVAGAFHDVGIWLDRTFDYLEPSANHACAWLAKHPDTGTGSLESQQRLVRNLIENHHKVRPVGTSMPPLVDAFRKGDWVDVTGAYRLAGLSRNDRVALLRAFPLRGFRLILARMALERARRYPRSPLPMMRW